MSEFNINDLLLGFESIEKHNPKIYSSFLGIKTDEVLDPETRGRISKEDMYIGRKVLLNYYNMDKIVLLVKDVQGKGFVCRSKEDADLVVSACLEWNDESKAWMNLGFYLANMKNIKSLNIT